MCTTFFRFLISSYWPYFVDFILCIFLSTRKKWVMRYGLTEPLLEEHRVCFFFKMDESNSILFFCYYLLQTCIVFYVILFDIVYFYVRILSLSSSLLSFIFNLALLCVLLGNKDSDWLSSSSSSRSWNSNSIITSNTNRRKSSSSTHTVFHG